MCAALQFLAFTAVAGLVLGLFLLTGLFEQALEPAFHALSVQFSLQQYVAQALNAFYVWHVLQVFAAVRNGRAGAGNRSGLLQSGAGQCNAFPQTGIASSREFFTLTFMFCSMHCGTMFELRH